MFSPRNARRAVLLTLCLLSACAAADPAANAGRGASPSGSSAFGDYLAGRFALSNGDFGPAADDLLRALAAAPNDPELIMQAFIACVNAGRPEAARLARQLPNNPIGLMVQGNEAAKSGDWAAAIAHYRALPADGVTQLLQPLLVAWAQQGADDTAAALATLRPFIDNPRLRAVAAFHAGMIADAASRPAQAGPNYQTAGFELAGQSPRFAMILASWLARSGHPDQAERILRQMAAALPEAAIALPGMLAHLTRKPVARATEGLAETYLTFATALRGQDTGEFAMIMSRLALEMRPESAPARLLAAEILATRKHLESAAMLLDGAAGGDDPIAPIIRLRHAAFSQRLQHTDEAIREVERIGRDYPDSPVPDLQLGELLAVKKRFPEAIAAFDRAIARIGQPTPRDWGAFYSRGIAYERTGQWARAEADLHRALALSPDQPSVLNYLGYSWADMGRNLDRARDMIQRAAAKRPNDGAITDSLGWVLFRQGNTAEAVKQLERAVELDSEDSTINGHLGDAYWASGRKIEAHYQWRRALTLKPTAEDAAKLEAKIRSHPNGTIASER